MNTRAIPIAILLWLTAGCGGGQNDGDAVDTGTEIPDTVEDPADVGTDDTPVEAACTGDGDCDDEDPCTADSCNLADGDCVHEAVDADGDGFSAHSVSGTDCGGDDCDDGDDAVYPDSDERRCGEDADCNGNLDADNDADGYDRVDCGGTDCEDEESGIHPDMTPGCGGDASDPFSDLDCNGEVDLDNDADDHDDASCPGDGDDCDDDRSDVFGGADEVCRDGVDQDCDTMIDGPFPPDVNVRVTTSENNPSSPEIVWTGSEFGLAWHAGWSSDEDLMFARLSPDGSVAASEALVSGTYLHPALVWTGSTYSILFNEMQGTTDQEVWLVNMDPDGTPAGSAILLTADDGEPTYVRDAVWTGSQIGIAMIDARYGHDEIVFSVIDPDGAVVTGETRLRDSTGDAWQAAVAWSGSEFGVVWTDERHVDEQIYFTRVTSAGTENGDESQITDDIGDSWYPDMMWTGSEYVVAWQDERHGDKEIYLVRLSPIGAEIGSEIRVTNESLDSRSPTLAWTGTMIGVSWEDARGMTGWDAGIWFRLLDPEGAFVGPEIAVKESASWAFDPHVAWTGSDFGIAWSDDFSSREVWAAVLIPCD
jgi:hypothetical protein